MEEVNRTVLEALEYNHDLIRILSDLPTEGLNCDDYVVEIQETISEFASLRREWEKANALP